ncbi:MAG: hypothetical protein WCB22_24515, partial [Pseudolabrys sp.]
SIGRFGGAGHVISVTKNTISGILFRVIHADSNVEKFPTAWTEIRPKEQYYGLDNRLTNLFELS